MSKYRSNRSLVKFARLALVSSAIAFAGDSFTPGNLVVSRSVYEGTGKFGVGAKLPPNCPGTAVCPYQSAVTSSSYPAVWLNTQVDPSFGITAPIFLDQITPDGTLVSTLAIPPSLATTSFASKSELGLNLSPHADVLTFMGYVAPVNSLDVSNSNTPLLVDPTNPVADSFYRAVVQVYGSGGMEVTRTNSFSGNNGRAAILANGYFYMVGNSNNGSGKPLAGVAGSAGVQMAIPGQPADTLPAQLGNFSISQLNDPGTGLPYASDKSGKDNNFRGLTIFQNTIYVSKGSGSSGINSVYQVGTPHTLPGLPDASDQPIAILPGFPSVPVKTGGLGNPFGLWFANATTLYVADEGDGINANAATNPLAGLQKWTLVNGAWKLAYIMQNGLNLGQQYDVPGYPRSLLPSTDGLRNITGRVNSDGRVTIWAVTSTVSELAVQGGDQGADPNQLVMITDVLANTDPAVAASQSFTTIKSAAFGEVLRGVSFTPGTHHLHGK